jgi:malate dehydrogenase (quinone)
MPSPDTDVLLIGAGIMSAHVGVMLKRIDPRLTIEVLEAADAPAGESSDGWNNAGTGHAGLCELNYTPRPETAGSPPDIAPAISIFARFEQSLQFWSHAVAHGLAPRPAEWIRALPHLSFVRGETEVGFLGARHAALTAHPFFRAMEFSQERDVLARWMPLMLEGRAEGPVAATRVARGTDVNFGELSRRLLAWLGAQEGARVQTGHRVTGLRRGDAGWEVAVRHLNSGETRVIRARFVFVGAGGGTIPLLRSAGLPAARGLAAFPIAGQWLVCENPAVVARHWGKVYGMPPRDSGALGGPHLDVRHLGGRCVLLFGPFATWTTRFLHRAGRLTDLPASIRPDNLGTLLRTGQHNRVLARFLVGQALQGREARLRALRVFYPEARGEDWRLVDAGIRVQALKAEQRGRITFGTEVVTSEDGSLAALLGASPGASVAANIALEVIERCFADLVRTPEGSAAVRAMVPSFGRNAAQAVAEHARHAARCAEVLGLQSGG